MIDWESCHLWHLTWRERQNVCWDVSGFGDLLREMKAAYSILWVEPGGVNLLGVSSTKIMWGLDRVVLSFSWTIFSLNVICWSVFLRCLYQPITLSSRREAQNSSVSAEKHNSCCKTNVYQIEVFTCLLSARISFTVSTFTSPTLL